MYLQVIVLPMLHAQASVTATTGTQLRVFFVQARITSISLTISNSKAN